MMDVYEDEYALWNHTDKNRPLSSVAHLPHEEVMKYGVLRDILEEYAHNEIGKFWNITLDRYLELPSSVTKLIRDITPELRKKRQATIEDIVDGMEG